MRTLAGYCSITHIISCAQKHNIIGSAKNALELTFDGYQRVLAGTPPLTQGITETLSPINSGA
jgi:hypothetical protein